MLTKGIIVKNISRYSAKVRIPIYHKSKDASNAVLDEDLPIAYYCAPPGIEPAFKEGEVVWVDFEMDQPEDPVIMGVLCRENSKSSSDITSQSLVVEVNAKIAGLNDNV